MNSKQWDYFCSFRESFKQKIEEWQVYSDELEHILNKINDITKTPAYPIETPIVYNKNLDLIKKDDEIKLIVIGDNPGKNEQMKINNSYLVGQAGKLADNFFKNHPELKIDFRKNVIILNKTPIHTAKTNMINYFHKFEEKNIVNLLNQTQIWMAKETANLHNELFKNSDESYKPELWLVGYSELSSKGIFTTYRKTLLDSYNTSSSDFNFLESWSKVFVYQHFSMNRFAIDLKNFQKTHNFQLNDSLSQLGEFHKNNIFLN